MDNQRRGPSFYRRPRQPIEKSESRPSPERERREAPPTGEGDTGIPGRTLEERTRIVVPRQERGTQHSGLELELREVRYGATAKAPYLRVTPRQQRFTRSAPGTITATRVSSTPPGAAERILQAVKGVVLGSPFASAQAIHERLTKVKALAVFSSDALSSSAYATEEILLVLLLAGSGSLHNALPIGLAIGALLALVTISYRQTIKAYPSGGGAYIVAHDNLGRAPGLIAAGALLVDYVLTVAVSTAAGVAAVTSAVPDLLDYRVVIGVVMVGLITVANLRGVRESGSIFALPTYAFIVMMTLAIVVGFAKVVMGDAPGSLLHEAPPQHVVASTQGLTLFLVLKAFSSGCAALTGVEAISNGVPAFKPPESSNARKTLTAMAVILGFLFLSITFLTSRFGFVPNEDETIVSEFGRTVFGENFIYYFYQATTALVLFLAANTSYADFPRLSAILSVDKFMPRQFSFRGDKLAFSNGILVLALAAIGLLIIFNGEVSNLIPLYAVGVFVSFTLSQGGMVIHWLRLKESGWRTSLVINAVGMVGTAVVAVIIGATKFMDGAWISIAVMGLLVYMFVLIRRHYDWYERAVAVEDEEAGRGVSGASPTEAPREHIVVPVDGINRITMGAIGMARAISGYITAVHLTDDPHASEAFRAHWARVVPDVPLLLIDSPYRAFAAPMVAYFDLLERTEPGMRITVILPGFKAHHWWERLMHNQAIRRLRPFLEGDERITVVEFDYDVLRDEMKQPPAPEAG